MLPEFTMIYITSDLHLDHRRILEYEPRRAERWGTGETSLEAMQVDLLEECAAPLRAGHRLLILGDVVLGNGERLAGILARMLPNRPLAAGTLQVVPGNHDKRAWRQLAGRSVLPQGVEVLPELVMGQSYTSPGGAKATLVLCHYPIESWPGMRVRPDAPDALGRPGNVHLHGHSHGRGRRVRDRLDVSWDAHGRILELGEAVALARGTG